MDIPACKVKYVFAPWLAFTILSGFAMTLDKNDAAFTALLLTSFLSSFPVVSVHTDSRSGTAWPSLGCVGSQVPNGLASPDLALASSICIWRTRATPTAGSVLEILQWPVQASGTPPCWGLLCCLASPWRGPETCPHAPQADLDLKQICFLKQMAVYFSALSRMHLSAFGKFKAASQTEVMNRE